MASANPAGPQPADSAVELVGDTDDLRAGAPVHESLLALLPLVGSWQGEGVGVAPSGRTFRYLQSIRFTHDGRGFLAYDARSWLLLEPDEGAPPVDSGPADSGPADSGPADSGPADSGPRTRPAWRESGFWRPGAGPDDVEVVLASNTGQAMLLTGLAADQRWELATARLTAAPTAVAVDGERRLYALAGGDLVYATELAPAGEPYAGHLNARLRRRR